MIIQFYKKDKVIYEINGKHGSYSVNHYGWKTKKDKIVKEVVKYWGITKTVYFGKVSQCLRYIKDCKISDKDKQDIKGVLKEIKEFSKEVDKIKEFKK
jgi:hypothetical protein